MGMRLFTAIAIDGPPLEGLKGFLAFAQGLNLPVKWVPPENIHLTLVFLGETREDQLTNLKAALKMATHGIRPFELEVGKLGAFSNPKKPKTLFADIVKGREEVEGLFECMAGPLANAGFNREERKFHPHVTLGKVHEESLPLEIWERLRKACPPSLGSLVVEKIHLMESRLTPRGSIYKVLESYPLGN
jgi:2'-5' RNA ligase